MHPVLVSIGSVEIHGFGVMLALGILLGVGVAVRQAESIGLDVERITNILLFVLVCSLIGARAVFVAVNWPYFAENPAAIAQLHRGGLVYYGGLIGGAAAGVLGAWWYGIPVAVFADIIPAGLCTGQCLGRIGCLLNGCCYGSPTELPWALTLPHGPGAHVARHPTAIYEAAITAGIGFFAAWLFRRRLRPASVMVSYLYLYGAGRFLVECLRGDHRGGAIVLGLSVSQCISLAAIGLAVAIHLGVLRRAALESSVTDAPDPV